MHARLGISDKEFAKVKFFFINNTAARITSVADGKFLPLPSTMASTHVGGVFFFFFDDLNR